MGAGVMGTTGTLALGLVLLVGCGADDGTNMLLEEPAQDEVVARCEALARGELPDDSEAGASIDDLVERERDECQELGIDLPPAGAGAGSGAADGGTGSAEEDGGTQRSDGGAQDDMSLEDGGSADDTGGDVRDAGEGLDGTLTELAGVYCDIRTEMESYQTQPPQHAEDRLEAESLELFEALEAIGSGLTDPAFQAEAHQICPEWVPDPTQ